MSDFDLNHSVKWQVSLSNGETFYEGKGIYQDNDPSGLPWKRLYDYIIDNKLEITSLALFTHNGQIFNLPSAGKRPRFKEFASIEKPIDYHVEHKLARETLVSAEGEILEQKVSDWYTVARAIYPTYEIQLWVDEMNTKNSWVMVIEK